MQHAHGGFAVAQGIVDHEGQIVLALERVGRHGVLIKRGEPRPQLIHEIGREGPQVHRYRRIGGEQAVGLAVHGGQRAVAGGNDMRVFHNALQIALGRGVAYAARNRAVFGQGILQQKARHGVFAGLVRLGEKIVNLPEGVAAVEIVAVDGGKGCVDILPAAHHGMAGAPGLGAAVGHGAALRQMLQVLKNVVRFHQPLYVAADLLAEILQNIVPDDENYPAKARTVGVEKGIINNALAMSAKGSKLLDAAETAADARRHDDQNGFAAHGINTLLVRFLSLYHKRQNLQICL